MMARSNHSDNPKIDLSADDNVLKTLKCEESISKPKISYVKPVPCRKKTPQAKWHKRNIRFPDHVFNNEEDFVIMTPKSSKKSDNFGKFRTMKSSATTAHSSPPTGKTVKSYNSEDDFVVVTPKSNKKSENFGKFRTTNSSATTVHSSPPTGKSVESYIKQPSTNKSNESDAKSMCSHHCNLDRLIMCFQAVRGDMAVAIEELRNRKRSIFALTDSTENNRKVTSETGSYMVNYVGLTPKTVGCEEGSLVSKSGSRDMVFELDF